MGDAAKAGGFVAEKFRKAEKGQHRQQQGKGSIVLQRFGEIEVEQLVDCALGAASRTAEAGKHLEGAAGEGSPRRIETEIYNDAENGNHGYGRGLSRHPFHNYCISEARIPILLRATSVPQRPVPTMMLMMFIILAVRFLLSDS